MEGLVIQSLGGFYKICSDEKAYEGKPRGLFRKEKTVITVGDRVSFSLAQDGSAVIEELHPRKNLFLRPPVANLDRLFIVAAAAEPEPDLLFVDKLSVIARHKGVEPIIVFSKADLKDVSAYCEIYQKAGLRALSLSVREGQGVDEIAGIAAQGISAFAGFSGTGKSSLLSVLLPREQIETGALSKKLGRGRHTTRAVNLYPLPSGGWLADTPGFSSLELTEVSDLRLAALPAAFPEFEPYLGACRFTNCSHRTEKGCAVLNALNEGLIAPSRHKSYCEFYDQLKAIPEWKK